MFMGPCIVRYENHISNQQDATFFCSLLIAMLYMFRVSLAHRQELRNCVCSLWYWHVDLCDDWYEYNLSCKVSFLYMSWMADMNRELP